MGLRGLPALVSACILVVNACAAQSGPSPSVQSSPSIESSPSTKPEAPSCPNPEGGDCLGPLEPGTYTTELLEIDLTYTVPSGWANYEDIPGNFLLVPPSGTLEGVNAGTGDFIGAYVGVAAASGNCEESPQPDVGTTPEAMMAWYADLPGLTTSDPAPVAVDALDGLVSDITLDAAEPAFCPYPGFEDIPLVPLIIGIGPASLHHVVIEDSTTRLYLLRSTDQTVAIEITDIDGGDSLGDLDAVVRTFDFGN